MNEADWKFFGMSHKFFKLFIFITFVGVILIIFNLMYSNYYYANPYVPIEKGFQVERVYGKNMQGDLLKVFLLFLAESAVALVLLLPHSYVRNYWARTLLLQIVFGGLLFFTITIAFDNGGLYITNAVGVLIINVIIFALFITSLIADHRNKEWI